MHQMQKPVYSSHSEMRQGPPPFAPCVPQCSAPFIFFSRLCPGDAFDISRNDIVFSSTASCGTTLFSRTITSPFSHAIPSIVTSITDLFRHFTSGVLQRFFETLSRRDVRNDNCTRERILFLRAISFWKFCK